MASGQALPDHLRTILERAAARPTPDELAGRFDARAPVSLSEASETTVRRLRDSLD